MIGYSFVSTAHPSAKPVRHRPVPAMGQQRAGQTGEHDRVLVAAAGEFPDAERVPRVEQRPLRGQSVSDERTHQQPDRDPLEEHHRQAHVRDRLAQARAEQEHHLRTGRIDGLGVVLAVDVGIDVPVAQPLVRW